ncbi:DUF2834 domain-containing protein [Paracoccaceae bacterium GXU_MW_L88]
MSRLRMAYLALAILGAVIPWLRFGAWFAEGGTTNGLFDAWTANPAVSGLSWDLLIAGIALTLWIAAEVHVRRDYVSLLALPALAIGVSCALPLYLFLRTRPQG